jgi:multisubunit Na+/H+ antiporter MnhB subunit
MTFSLNFWQRIILFGSAIFFGSFSIRDGALQIGAALATLACLIVITSSQKRQPIVEPIHRSAEGSEPTMTTFAWVSTVLIFFGLGTMTPAMFNIYDAYVQHKESQRFEKMNAIENTFKRNSNNVSKGLSTIEGLEQREKERDGDGQNAPPLDSL